MPEDNQHAAAVPGPISLKTIMGAHLEKLLSSSAFQTADRLRDLLRFAVQETLAGRGGDLKEYVLATAVLGKSDSFDPKADPIIRVQMRRVRERLHRYYATEGRYDSVLIEIPKGTYTPTFRSAPPGGVLLVPAILEAPPIVGRQKELSELRSAFALAAAGHGQLFCLSGEPGIGKTTVVEAYLRELARSGVACYLARGRCSERLAGSEAYLPVLESLETLLRAGDQSLVRLISDVAPTWYVQIAPLTEDPSADRIRAEIRMASQERLKRELLAFVAELTHRQPLVLFLDDLHWADASTIDVLSYVASRCGSERILIVGTYRPSELLETNHAFIRAKLELQGHGLCRESPMQFLTPAEVERYLALQFPRHLFPPELAVRIHARTEGNPLFMADLVRFLRDRGRFTHRDGYWVLSEQLPALGHELPESVRSLIQKKIGQLSGGDRRLMAAAAVQGQEFDSAVVARALQLDPAEVEERLETLDHTQGFVRLIGDRELPDLTLTLRYSFVHVLYQNALQSALTATRKSALSLAVAQTLLDIYGHRSDEVASQLALLFEAGRDFGRASDYFLSAARNATRVYAAQEAIALVYRAIANAEKLTGEERYSRVMAAALHSAALHESFTQFDEAVADFRLAESAAGKLGNRDAQVNAIYGQAYVLFLAKRLPEVREQGARALQLAQAAGSVAGVASSNVISGLEPFCTGDLAVARQRFEQAIPVLRQRGPFKHCVDAVCFRGILANQRLEHEQANEDLGWVYEKAGEAGLTFDLLIALYHRARTRANQGQLFEASEMLKEAQRLAELLGDRFWRPRIVNTQAWLLTELFDTEAALRLNTEAVQASHDFGDVEAECMSRINAARDYLVLGEPQQAWEHLRQAEALYEQDVWFRWIYYPRLQAEMASYWIARGDLVQALSHAQESLEQASRTLSRKRMAWARRLLGDVALLEHRLADALGEYNTGLQLLEQHPCPMVEWRILQAAAGAANMLGDRAAHSVLLARARATVQMLAESVLDHTLRKIFLRSRPIRELLS